MSKKTVSKTTASAKTKRTAKPRTAETRSQEKQSASESREDTPRGAPVEHFRGERNRGLETVEGGSLDEETLDRDAPYNRTYGRA
jgi:hypothetical protein